MRDVFNKMRGRTRFVVCRIMLHLGGSEVAPILGLLNRTAREAIDEEGDLKVVGEGLVEISESLLRYDESWVSASNEGDEFWDEGEAGDYEQELFNDSAQRFGSGLEFDSPSGTDEPLSFPATRNVVVMIVVAFEGEVPDLETDLSNIQAMKQALKALINLHYSNKLRAIRILYSPAQFGEELTNDQLLQYYPELIPL
jgi:uncharacterized membrane protein